MINQDYSTKFDIGRFSKESKEAASLVRDFEFTEYRAPDLTDLTLALRDALIVSGFSFVLVSPPMFAFAHMVGLAWYTTPIASAILMAIVGLKRYEHTMAMPLSRQAWSTGKVSWEHLKSSQAGKAEVRFVRWQDDMPFQAGGRDLSLKFPVSHEVVQAIANVCLEANSFSSRLLTSKVDGVTATNYGEIKTAFLEQGIIRLKGKTEHAGFEIPAKGKAMLRGLAHSPTALLAANNTEFSEN